MQTLFAPVFEQYNLLQHPFYLAWNEGQAYKGTNGSICRGIWLFYSTDQ